MITDIGIVAGEIWHTLDAHDGSARLSVVITGLGAHMSWCS